jgi:D-glycero-alpha-D-manno-heptose-7-phosphate kinase
VIVTRTPLRISLGGGGTDLPNYAAAHGGFVLSAAIDRYVYVVLRHGRVDARVRFSHDETSVVDHVGDLGHAITREALRGFGCDTGVEVASLGSVPAGTGLGSSGAYCVGVLRALHAWRGDEPAPADLAEQAWALEHERLGRWVGKQDHYLASLGGVQALHIGREGAVRAERLDLDAGCLAELSGMLLLAYTGRRRDSHDVLTAQDRPPARRGAGTGGALHEIKRIGRDIAAALTDGRTTAFAELLHQHWKVKRASAGQMTDPWLDHVYETARQRGARGGKLLGAGGGGFFLFAVDPGARSAVVAALRDEGLPIVPFAFAAAGTEILLDDKEHRP